jgi:hypothetical protein
MMAYSDRLRRRSIELQWLLECWTHRVERLPVHVRAETCLTDRSIDIAFHHLNSHEISLLQDLYSRAGVDLTSKRAKHFMPIWTVTRAVSTERFLSLQSHFGISPDDLRSRFSFYFDRFDISRKQGPWARADLQSTGSRCARAGHGRTRAGGAPISCSPGLSNAYLLTCRQQGRGEHGMGFESQVHRANFDAVDSSPIRCIIVTQGHYDHVGGLGTMRDPATQVIAQANWRQWRDETRPAGRLPGKQQRFRVLGS